MSNKLCEIGNKFANPMPLLLRFYRHHYNIYKSIGLIEATSIAGNPRVVYQWQRDP